MWPFSQRTTIRVAEEEAEHGGRFDSRQSGVGQRVQAVVGEDHDEAVGHLREATLEPAELGAVDAAVGGSRGAGGGEHQVAHRRRVVGVVGGRVARVLVGEAVPQVGPDELTQAERSAVRVRRHGQEGTRHEGLRPTDVGLVNLVEVEPVREPQRLTVAAKGGREPVGDEANSLAEHLVVAQAAEPG